MMMLSTPFMSSDFSGKYPTQTGSLVTYSMGMNFDTNTKQENNGSSNALSVMKKESEDFQKLSKTIKNRIPKQKINKKKFKGFEKRKLKQKKSLASDTQDHIQYKTTLTKLIHYIITYKCISNNQVI